MLLRPSRQWLLTTCFWTLGGVVSGAQIWLSMINHHHSFARVVACQVLIWSAWIPLSFAIRSAVRQVPLAPPRPRGVLIHLPIALAISAAHAAWWVWLELVVVPFDWMNPTDFGDRYVEIILCQAPLSVLLYGLVVLAVYAGDYYEKYREREVSAAQLEKSLAEARLRALEVQLQPHFLFNTLNAISTLVRVQQNAEAVGMIAGLSDLLRYALERSGDPRVRLDDEIAMARRYLEIQRMRFGDRLSFEIHVEQDAGRAAVPVLLVQPLVENAIHHGIARHEAPGRVTLRAFRHEGNLRIELFNTGELPERVEHGIGLSNTLARLVQLYGDRYRFALTAEQDGVMARLTLPWSEVP